MIYFFPQYKTMYSLFQCFCPPDMDNKKHGEFFFLNYHGWYQNRFLMFMTSSIFTSGLPDALLWEGTSGKRCQPTWDQYFFPSPWPPSRSCLHKNWGYSLAYNGSSFKKKKILNIQMLCLNLKRKSLDVLKGDVFDFWLPDSYLYTLRASVVKCLSMHLQSPSLEGKKQERKKN